MDIHLSLSHDFKEFCVFDVKEQALKKRDPGKTEVPDYLAKYLDTRNVFKAEKLFFDFVASVHSIISTLALPPDFSMLPLTTVFNPCTRCINTGLLGLQVMRCRHRSDCQQHKICRCQNTSKCKCLDDCGCSEYAKPSLTWSKVGVVLHLQWREEDNTFFTIDCDLNCPTYPTYTRYSGESDDAFQYLMREQPLGWLEEASKLEEMTSAASFGHVLKSKNWPVKFRLINKDTVIPSQVTSTTPIQATQGDGNAI